ncbi:hypothetical protein GOB94_06125 [Granulicella sp. 5B5]|uniref:hypothetical protein n=1 Tax=Granulicella sp. 5B5 TaxID=1617967 RepID=UPI0015F6CC1C|nr:hypothetical protein [Granulicella sp. 5B5]QMV18309.1 hypothetical protein GOB94_06125 [Granulicella sp. 5B5]
MAQSLSTASKAAEISVFGAYMGGTPDYGPHTWKGISAGGDFTVFPRFILKPALEVRGNVLSARAATEKTVLFGPRVQLDWRGRFHPYGDFLIGAGEILFHPDPAPGYSGDRSKVYSYGGGINIDVAYHLSAKFDFQQQSWNLGPNSDSASSGNFTLTPRTLQIGVTYTLPFRFLNHASDYR